MKNKNPKVDIYLKNAKNWQNEIKTLRKILLDCGLTEELKWRLPCYTFEEGNIVIIQGFKNFCALMFFKGALLKDTKGKLVPPGKDSQAARRIEFTSEQEIKKIKTILKAYVKEAIEVERSGLKVKLKDVKEFEVPEEFKKRLNKNSKLKIAFESLTPGRQRAYLLHFSSAKQSETRELRIDKCMKRILAGKGLND